MSKAVINMEFINKTSYNMVFLSQGNPEHGTPPTPSSNPVSPGDGTSTVTASSNSSISGPGPEGTYIWQIVEPKTTLNINVSYNHPYGKGDTWVTVECPAGYQASGCGQGPSQTLALNQNCSSLQDHDNAQCQITVTPA